MLQIRLSKGGGASSGDGVATPGVKSSSAAETVTVACPDHLVLADLPVAKSLGAVTASAVRSVGRRNRRHHGERVHFCVRCDFPIAIYGRLMPCEHAFCLACARTDSSCHICDERIQKIQTIKLMEGIYICGAPHCLKSFLKRSDLEAHITEAHADLIRPNIEKEEANDNNALNNPKPSSTDAQKQSQQPEVSTARAPPKPSAFSPSSNSQDQDREERTRRHQSRDPSPRPQLQAKPPQFQNQQQPQTSDFPAENQPQNWFPQPPALPPFQQNPDQFPMNYPLPYPVQFPTDGSQPLYNVPQDSNQGSVLGVQPSPSAMGGFPNNLSQQWAMGFMSVPLQPLHMNNPQFLQGEGMTINPQIQGKESDQQPPPPLPLTPPPALAQQQQQQINRNRDFPPGFG